MQLEELSYIAGFFDGEGCITLYINPSGYPCVHVSMANNNKSILEWIKSTFEGSIRPTGVLVSGRCWALSFNHQQAIPFLEAIRPHIRRRRDKVDIALAICRLVGPRGEVPDDRATLQRFLWLEEFEKVPED
jgi:hypothetical protein